MVKLKKYTLADLMQDRKKKKLRVKSSMGDVYKFDTDGHLLDEPVEENNTPYDTVWIGNKSYQSSTKLAFSSFETNPESVFDNRVGLMITNADMGLFKFFAQNCDVEWAAFYESSDGEFVSETICNLQTTHQNYRCQPSVPPSLLGGDYNTMIHNHPGYNQDERPSPDDEQNKSIYIENSGNRLEYFGIYDEDLDRIVYY